MRKDAVAAAAALPDESPWRSLCSFLEGVADHLTGERERARTALDEAVRRAAPATPNIHTLALAQLALLEIDEGDADAASTLMLQATAQADRVGLIDYPTSALLFAVAALVRARHGRVERALRDARRCDRLLGELNDFSPWYEAESRIVAARALLLLDDVPSARRLLTEAEARQRSTPDATVLEDWRREAERDAESVGELGGRWPLTKAELRLLHHLPSSSELPGDRRAAVRLDQHRQDAGAGGLPQARGLFARRGRGDRTGRRSHTARRGLGERLGLEPVELVLVDRARVEELLGLLDLTRRAARRVADVIVELAPPCPELIRLTCSAPLGDDVGAAADGGCP